MQSSYTKHNVNDYIGKKYGLLTVIGQSEKTSRYSNKFDFQCDCGNIISECPGRVLYGHKKSCGQCRGRNTSYSLEQKINSSIGKKFGKLTIIGISHKENSGKTYALCKCDCGRNIDVLPNVLFNNQINSCGCYRDGRTKHPLYGTWFQMISRCENPNSIHYDRYGGRGISVCEEWHDFWKFVSWADSVGGRPQSHTLDRINNDGNYEPSNCRWADWRTQRTNTSANIFLEYNGSSKTISEWAEDLGIHPQTLQNRIKRGWTVERALTDRPSKNCHTSRYKLICQYDKNGTLIGQYKSLSDLPPEFKPECVSDCANGRRKTNKGYIWKYEDE